MKKQFIYLFGLLFFFSGTILPVRSQDTIVIEDFDGSTPAWSNDIADSTFVDPSDSDQGLFIEASSSNNSNFSGDYMHGKDMGGESGEPTESPFTYTFEDVDVSGYTDVEVSFDYAVKANADAGQYEVVVDGTGQGQVTFYDDPDSGWESGTITVSVGTASTVGLIITGTLNGGSDELEMDNFKLTGTQSGSVTNPASFTATTTSTSQIDLAFTQNGNSDDVMLVYDTDNSFGIPADGTSYSTGNTLPGDGGAVIYVGATSPYSHTSLDEGTTYYYKAYSVDDSDNYSSGLTDEANTLKSEPSNDVNDFAEGTVSDTSIELTWTENDGAVVAQGYLIKASTGSISDPSDGTDPSDDTDLTDGSGNVKVAHGATSYTFNNCSNETTYHFAIYPYTNSGADINFKTDAEQTASVTTLSAPKIPSEGDIIITEIMPNPDDVGDSDGEYLELFNTTHENIDLKGWIIKDPTERTITSSLVIPAGGFVVIGKNADYATNGNMEVDYELSDLALTNSGDEVYLVYSDGTTGIDSVEYADTSGSDWQVSAGKAMVFTGSPTEDNNDGANWAEADNREYGFGRMGSDLGSPGANGSSQSLFNSITANVEDNWNNAAGNTNMFDEVVVIDTVNITLTATDTCANLIIHPGSSVIIENGQTLVVNHNIHLQSPADSGAVGSLVNHGTLVLNGKAMVERFIEGNRWTYLSSPVSGDSTLTFNANAASNYTFSWDETSASSQANGWNEIADNTTTLNTMEGYAVNLTNQDSTITFSGDLHDGDIDYNLSVTGDDNLYRWNLVGNPYPSPVDWYNDAAWDKSNIHNAIYFQQEEHFCTAIGGARISTPTDCFNGAVSAMQAFWVFASGNDNDVFGITNNARIHASDTVHLKSGTQHFVVRIQISGKNHEDETVINLSDDASVEFDAQLDAFKFGITALNEVSKSGIYSFDAEGNPLAINSVPKDVESISLGLNVATAGDYTISASSFSNIDVESIQLTDNSTGDKLDLKQDNYTFTAEKGQYNNRFELQLLKSSTSIANASDDVLKIYSHNGLVYIQSKEFLSNAAIRIFDLTGRKIWSGKSAIEGMKKINLNRQGYYIVNITTENNNYNQKVFIK